MIQINDNNDKANIKEREYSDNNNLISCPWCGNKPKIKKSNDKPPSYRIQHGCNAKKFSYPPNITIETRWCKTIKEAITIWNTINFMKTEKE